ncbi:MAG: aspartate--tRNA ligase [Bacilli bacterium]
MNKYRTHFCGDLTLNDIGSVVKIAGWVENIRDHGGVIFVDIRDQYGTVQIVSNDNAIFDNVTRESTVCVTGKVIKRDEELINKKIKTGYIEILTSKLEILSACSNVLPFEIKTSSDNSLEVRLKYRYLDMRNKKVKDKIMFRADVVKYLRDKTNSLNFTEITTPILTASSPEGARDFVVPSRKFHGKFYALPQAPQLFKQLLMIAGFDRYFQIAPCFRDEDARSDRIYGEFYQLDLEMSFATEDDVCKVTEDILYSTFSKFSDKLISSKPFKRISYKDSMLKYGTDKPDLRNPLYIVDLTNIFVKTSFKPFKDVVVKGIKVPCIADKSNSWFNEVVDYAKSINMPGIGYIMVNDDMTFRGPIDKFLTEVERDELIKAAELKANSVLFFIADKCKAPNLAGLMRIELGRKLNLLDKNRFDICIINDFPMFEYDDESEKYIFMHNPFSLPKDGKDIISKKPTDIIAYQFDFVCNGVELLSGAVRNHDLKIMRDCFKIAGYDEEDLKEKFGSFYNAFNYGVPPHAGMAIGIDRMLMLLKGEDNIRETIAFPMTSGGQDLMMGSPTTVNETQLKDVHIKIR